MLLLLGYDGILCYCGGLYEVGVDGKVLVKIGVL